VEEKERRGEEEEGGRRKKKEKEEEASRPLPAARRGRRADCPRHQLWFDPLIHFA